MPEEYIRTKSDYTEEELEAIRIKIREVLNKNALEREQNGAKISTLTPPRYDDIYWEAIETWDREATGNE